MPADDPRAAPLALSSVPAQALVSAATAEELILPQESADLILPGEQLDLDDAQPGEGFGQTQGGLAALDVGYLRVEGGTARLVSPVWVAPDGSIACWLRLTGRHAWPRLDPALVEAALGRAGVVYGLQPDAVEILRETSTPAAPVVARATPPRDGSDGTVEWAVDLDRRAGRLLPDGSIDLRERNSAIRVAAGAEVAHTTGPTAGEDGTDVRGARLAARPGQESRLQAGDNVTVEAATDGGQRFVAAIDGHVEVAGDTVHVRDVFVVEGDVDYEVGNIDVPGNVEVRGLVASGFSVKAGGTVTVSGTVENGATIHAGADILVGQGILGEKTRVVAGATVTTKFVQGSAVAAAADIVVGSYAFNARLRAGRCVRVEPTGGERGGSLVGGQVVAGVAIDTPRLGAADGDRTVAGIAVDPAAAKRLRDWRQEHQRLSDTAATSLAALGISSASDREQLTRLLARTPAERLDDVEARLQELRTSAKRLDDLMLSIEQEETEQAHRLARGRIRVQREALADVQIQLGDRARRLTEAIREGCEFYLAEGKVQWRALAAAD